MEVDLVEIPNNCPYIGMCVLFNEFVLSNLSWKELKGLAEEGKEMIIEGDAKLKVCQKRNGINCIIDREFCGLITSEEDPNRLLLSELRKRVFQ